MPDPDPTAIADPVRYLIRHSSAYRYGDDILLAHHLLHLSPRATPRQRVIAFRMDIEPRPAAVAEHLDYFGNPAVYVEIQELHHRFAVRTEIEVEVMPASPGADDPGPPWETLRDDLAIGADAAARQASLYAYPSAMVPVSAELRDYAAPSFPPGRGIGTALNDLTRRIHADFIFDPNATTISTPIADVLKARRGVCQDFAHLGIGCLRTLGLAARYVSGYLRTLPPPGRPRLVGADVSHAWLSAWCGGDDWRDVDPTNGRPGSTDMIALAWGRDYDDVSPVRGVILGSRHQFLSVEVDVQPIAAPADTPEPERADQAPPEAV
jgi:transglutaminase-like putative cysteine protease